MKKVFDKIKNYIFPSILLIVSIVFIWISFLDRVHENFNGIFMSLGAGFISSGIISFFIEFKSISNLRKDDYKLFSMQKSKTEEFLATNYLFFYKNIGLDYKKQINNHELDSILDSLFSSGKINSNLFNSYKKEFDVYLKQLDNYLLKSKNIVDIKAKIQPLRDSILILIRAFDNTSNIVLDRNETLKLTKRVYSVINDMFRAFKINKEAFMVK